MRDLMSQIHTVRAIAPAAAGTDNTAIEGVAVDHKGYDSATYSIQAGALTDADATFAVLIEESDTGAFAGEENAVADADLVGSELLAGFQFDDDNETRKIGYIGDKQHTKITITPTGNNSGNIYVSATCILGHPHRQPTPNPPQ